MVGYDVAVERMMARLFDSLKESDRRRYAAIGAEHRQLAKKWSGRRRLIGNDPAVEANFPKVLEDHSAGDPMRLEGKWTNLSPRQIASRVTELGMPVSRHVVSQLLKKYRYRQRKARTMGPRHPDRNALFAKIGRLRREPLATGLPVVSIDTKKKELLGDFYRDGPIEAQGTIEVNDHNFTRMGSGTVIPHGIYGVGLNRGFVQLNTSHDTSALACDSLAAWWEAHGSAAYPWPGSSWCCATAAGAIAPRGTSSRSGCRSWPIDWGSRSGWRMTRRTARNTTRSSIGYFPTGRGRVAV